MIRRMLFAILLLCFSFTATAANQGKITKLLFSSSSSIWGGGHSNIVQVIIEGGYSASGCNSSAAAIRKSDEHLISAALAAYMAGKPIGVELSNKSTYHDGSRCIITDLFIGE